MEILVYVLTGLGSVLSMYIVQNSKLKDGITDFILSLFGKFGSKKIDLKLHKAFIIIKNYDNQLNLFLFNNYTKSLFYKEFVGVIFKNILNMCTAIIVKYESKSSDVEYVILEELENCKKAIDSEINAKLNIPSKIQNQIEHWKSLMLTSVKNSIEVLVNDEVNDSDYFKVYRTFDILLTFTNFITGTGSILFNNINGAFDEIASAEIYKSEKG